MPRTKTTKPTAKKEKVLQPEINIGMVGHVDHGKTTLLERLSGVWTDTHSEEIKRGITIRLGYADTVFYKEGKEYTTRPKNKTKAKLLRKVSFIDAPGHESLMATMLSGATIMDGALLLIAANEECPQPQTREHLMALEIVGVKNVVIVQNKVDLADEKGVLKNYEQIKKFVKGSIPSIILKYYLGLIPKMFKLYHSSEDKSKYLNESAMEMTADVLFDTLIRLDKVY